jgi:hypothetical protein
MLIISALGKLRQEDYKSEASLGYFLKSKSALTAEQDPVSRNKETLKNSLQP